MPSITLTTLPQHLHCNATSSARQDDGSGVSGQAERLFRPNSSKINAELILRQGLHKISTKWA